MITKSIQKYVAVIVGVVMLMSGQANFVSAAGGLSSIQASASGTSATISWVTAEPMASRVLYGSSLAFGQEASDPTVTVFHQIQLSNLAADTTYYFHIQTGDEPFSEAQRLYTTFYTASSFDIASLQKRLAELQAQLLILQGQRIVQLTKTLQLGDRGEEVRVLQQFLNQDPRTQVASGGPGSPGNETSYFGPATKAAVIKYQSIYQATILAPAGLAAPTGIVGDLTRAQINSGGGTSSVANSNQSTGIVSGGGGGSSPSLTPAPSPSTPSPSPAISPSPSPSLAATPSPSPSPTPTVAPPNPSPDLAVATMRSSITQYGITWTFDKAYQTGQFITGDYWVIGPVVVTSVTPNWDGTKNGSMLNPDPAKIYPGSTYPAEKQGYDTRAYGSYDASARVTFPVTLQAEDSLVSTKGMTTPYDSGRSFIDEAAVLSVVSSVPYADEFTPTYFAVTGAKPVFRTSDIHRELLPQLALPSGTSSNPADLAQRLRGPRLGHLFVHGYQYITPVHSSGGHAGELVYSRDSASLISDAMTALMLANPNEQLLITVLQRGIENYFMFKRNPAIFPASGGHSNGNKGPVVMAGILFNNADMKALSFLSNEDGQTYTGTGWTGATALWSENHGSISDYEEKDPTTWTIDGITPGIPAGNNSDSRSESYRRCCTSPMWVGEALVIRLLNGQSAWNHPAFFDYVDRWMTETYSTAQLTKIQAVNSNWGQTAGSAASAFVTAMWNNYRGLTGPGGLPAAPSSPPNFSASAAVTPQINLSWGDVATETSFVLERSLSSGSGFSVISTLATDVTAYSDSGLASGTTYYYRLKAVNGTGSSTYTSVASATTPTAAATGGNLGPVGHWTMDGSAADAVGGVNGSTSGSFTTGKIGQAVSLDGTQGVNLGSPLLTNWGISNQMTIALWVNQASAAGNQALFAKGMWAGNVTATSILLYLSGGVPSAQLGDGAHILWLGGSTPFASGSWHHIVVTLSGTTGTMYIDGASVGQYGDAAFTNLNDPAYDKETGIGYVADHGQLPFTGLLDDVRLYNRALSAGEIQSLYATATIPSSSGGADTGSAYLANTLEQMLATLSALISLFGR